MLLFTFSRQLTGFPPAFTVGVGVGFSHSQTVHCKVLRRGNGANIINNKAESADIRHNVCGVHLILTLMMKHTNCLNIIKLIVFNQNSQNCITCEYEIKYFKYFR